LLLDSRSPRLFTSNWRFVRKYGGARPVFHSDLDIAQTFTVGVSGVLSRVDLSMFRYRDVQSTALVDITRVIGIEPDFTEDGLLARRVVPASQVPLYSRADHFNPRFTVSVDLSASGIVVRPNDVLAIVMRSDGVSGGGADNFHAVWATRYDYERGNVFYYQPPTNVVHIAVDNYFRTFVLIPEPSTAALAALCGIWIATSRTRRQQPTAFP
jgi:hypothetical protein